MISGSKMRVSDNKIFELTNLNNDIDLVTLNFSLKAFKEHIKERIQFPTKPTTCFTQCQGTFWD
jgi:hypothetical protein